MHSEHTNGIELSNQDCRNYRYLELQNGLKVMLISNDSGDSDFSSADALAAAALCVNVGSFSDPPEAQGLNHLLDHMLLNQKCNYSKFENFKEFIHKYDGMCDTVTSNEHTLFYFGIMNLYFEEALEQFVKQFINPQFNEELMHKEIENLENEFQKLKTRGYAQLRGFISALANKNSPFYLFGKGNKLSLMNEPERCGIDLLNVLESHWKNLYSAHRMTLAIQSKDSLTVLEKIVREKFCNIPVNKSVKLNFSKYVNSFNSSDFKKLYHVESSRNKEQLRLIWSIPSICSLYQSNPVAVLNYFLSDKSQYGLEHYLKANDMATEIKCEFSPLSDFDNSAICALITICVDLTNNGSQRLFKIIDAIYEYLKFLALEASKSSFHFNSFNNNINDNKDFTQLNGYAESKFDQCLRDLQLLQKKSFLYRSVFGPQETVTWIANMLQRVSPQDVHSAYLVIKNPDLKVYANFFNELSKNQACFIHTCRLGEQLKKIARFEKWYNVKYVSEDIPGKFPHNIFNHELTIKYALPPKNFLIAEDFSLLRAEDDMEYPVKLQFGSQYMVYESYGSVWYQQWTSERKAEANIFLQISSSLDQHNVKSACLLNLLQWSMKINMSVMDGIIEASGNEYSLNIHPNGPELIIYGSSDKIYELYTSLFIYIMSDITKEQFLESKRRYQEELEYQISNPDINADKFNSYLWNDKDYHLTNLLHTLKKITIADLFAYHSQYFHEININMFVIGNVKAQLARDLYRYTVLAIRCKPKPNVSSLTYISLRPGTYCISGSNRLDAENVNQIVQFERIENATLEDHIYCKLITELLKRPIYHYFQRFNINANEVNLNYYTQYNKLPLTMVGIRLSIANRNNQTNYDFNYLRKIITLFWQQVAPRIIACVNLEELDRVIKTLIHEEKEVVSLKFVGHSNWNAIKLHEFHFELSQRKQFYLQQITRKMLFQYFYNQYLDPNKQTSLIVEFDTKLDNAKLNNLSSNIPYNNIRATINSFLNDQELYTLPNEIPSEIINKLENSDSRKIMSIETLNKFRLEHTKYEENLSKC